MSAGASDGDEPYTPGMFVGSLLGRRPALTVTSSSLFSTSFILLHKSHAAFVFRHLFTGTLSSGGTLQFGVKTIFSRRNAVYLFFRHADVTFLLVTD